MKLKTVNISDIKDVEAPQSKTQQLSLIERGQDNPIRLRPVKDGYEVIDGRRRLADMIGLGYDEVIAIVAETTNEESNWLALTLNSGTPNELDEAEHIMALLALGYTQKIVAEKINYSQATISQRVRLCEKLCDELKEKLRIGEITYSTAIVATKLPLDEQRILASEDKITNTLVTETLRDWDSQELGLDQLELPDVLPDTSPGLFLSPGEMKSVVAGDEIEVKWNGKLLILKGKERK